MQAEALQPVLFQIDDKYYIKLDNQACPLVVPSCFSDCVELLLYTFHVFNLDFPYELRLCYALIELILGIKSSIGSSAIVSDFYRKLL